MALPATARDVPGAQWPQSVTTENALGRWQVCRGPGGTASASRGLDEGGSKLFPGSFLE